MREQVNLLVQPRQPLPGILDFGLAGVGVLTPQSAPTSIHFLLLQASLKAFPMGAHFINCQYASIFSIGCTCAVSP